MWLDAFKPQVGNMQKVGVPGVPGVPSPSKPNAYAGFGKTPMRNTAKNAGVPGVPVIDAGTRGTPRNTGTNGRCSSDKIPLKPNIHAGFRLSGTPGTPGTPQKHDFPKNARDCAESLTQFRFDLVQAEINAGCAVDEIQRVNNMAWEFMQADQMGFDDAITLAAQIVVYGQVAACEAAYVDVMALFNRLQTNDRKSS